MIICTWRIREWELQILSWSSSVQHEIAALFTISFQCLKKDFQKLAGLWLAGEVVNHVGIYGSKAAEGLSAFQRRSLILAATKQLYEWFSPSVCPSVTPFYPSALRAGGVLSSQSGRAGGRLPDLQNPYLCNRLTDFLHSKFCGL